MKKNKIAVLSAILLTIIGAATTGIASSNEEKHIEDSSSTVAAVEDSSSILDTKSDTKTYTSNDIKGLEYADYELQELYPAYYPTQSEWILLCNLVAREYGADYVPTEEKAKIVAVVMNRVHSDLFPDNIWDVIHQEGQFSDAYVSCWDLSDTQLSPQVTQSVMDAVDYYFNNQWSFDNIMFYYGDGSWNYFREEY